MLVTVKDYADNRGVSESTVKKHIRKIPLTLSINPLDARQRILTTDQQAALDKAIGCKPPIPTEPLTVEVLPTYERSESVSLVMAEAQVSTAIATSNFNQAQDNPLYQALSQQVQAMELENQLILQNIQTQATANLDATAAIGAIDQLRIIQAARAEAAAEFVLKQQVKAQALTEFELQSRGLVPVVPQQPHPTPPPTSPSSPPPSVVDVRSSSASPF